MLGALNLSQGIFNAPSRLTNYGVHWLRACSYGLPKSVWSIVLRNHPSLKTIVTKGQARLLGIRSLMRAIPSPLAINRNSLGITVAGIAMLTLSSVQVAHQDIEELVVGNKRWLTHLEQKTGTSNILMSIQEVDQINTASIGRFKGIRPLGEQAIAARTDIGSKPQTVNRALKGDRVTRGLAQQPPTNFTAGSILQRHSSLLNTKSGVHIAKAFVKPKPSEEAYQIAQSFHKNIDPREMEEKNLPVMVARLVEDSKHSVLAYAEEDPVNQSPFAAVLRDENPSQAIPKLNKKDHAWADDPLPKHVFSASQQKCLATGIYFESRGESARGQAAVAQVILNRVRNPAYPNTICGVVFQNKDWTNRCQFSFACDRIKDRVRNKKLWNLATQIARETTAGRIWLAEVGSATHYHASYVRPKWARAMTKVGKIGLHIFYRTRYGGLG